MQRVFLVDVDDVLAEFSSTVIEKVSAKIGRQWRKDPKEPPSWCLFDGLSIEETRVARDVLGAPGFAAMLPPVSGAAKFVNALRKLGLEVYAVTALPDSFSAQHWVEDRYWWLWRHMGIDAKHTIFAEAKHLVRGDFFLDDRPKNVLEWAKAFPDDDAMLRKTPVNEALIDGFEGMVVETWVEVLECVLRRYK